MQALLVTLIELFLNYKRSAGRGEPGLPGSQGKQASQIDERLVKDHLRGVGAAEISVNSPRLYPQVAVEGAREKGTSSPTRVSPHLGTPR
jgi:hypothetical protein